MRKIHYTHMYPLIPCWMNSTGNPGLMAAIFTDMNSLAMDVYLNSKDIAAEEWIRPKFSTMSIARERVRRRRW